MSRLSLSGPVVIALLLAALPTLAQTHDAPRTTPLTRRAALQTAAANNLQLLSDRLSREATVHAADAAKQRFVPSLVLTSSYADNARVDGVQPSTPVESDRTRATSYSGGVEWQAPTGTSLALTASNSHAITGVGAGQDAPALSLTATQRLLKNGWKTGAASDLQAAKLDAAIAREGFRSALNDFLTEVAAAYWELAFNQADLEIKQRSLERAKAQYDDTKENIRRGLLPPTDIYIVEENVVSFEQQLLSTGQQLALSQSRLAALLQQAPGMAYTAVDPLDDCNPVLPGALSATQIAEDSHPALAARRLALAKANIRLSYAKNQAWPTLDLSASFALNGVSGSAALAWSEVATAAKPNASVGLRFAIPLWLEPALANVHSNEAEAKRQLLDLKLQESKLAFAIADALTELATQKQQLVLARRIFELAEKKLAAENEKYRNGVSRLAEVVRFQRELDSALMSFRAAQRTLLVNYARLRRTMGQLDQDAGVSLR